MTDWYKFYRCGLACALHYKEEGDTYFGYVGFDDDHEFHGSIFKTVKGIGIHKYSLSLGNENLDRLWWMGFHKHTTYQKALDDLKDIADAVGPDRKPGPVAKPRSPGFDLL